MTVRRKILLLVAGFLFVSLAFTIMSLEIAGGRLERRVEETGRAMVAEFTDAVGEYLGRLVALAASLEISLSAIGPMPGDDYRRLFERYLDAARSSGVQTVFMGFESRMFVDATGWTPPEGYDPRPRPWYVETIRNGGVTVTSPYIDLITGEPIISVTVPVRERDGELLGVAGLDVSLAQLTRKVTEKRLFGAGTPFLVERGGSFVASSRPEWTLPENITKATEAVPPELAEVGSAVLADDPGFLRLRLDGEEMLLFHSPAGDGFTFGILFPNSVLRSFVRGFSLLHLFGGAAVIVLALLMLAPMAREIGRSLFSLSNTVDSIAQGLSDNRDPTETAYRVQVLADEVGETMARTSVDEIKKFLESMENVLRTIGRQGEEIAALTQEAIASQNSLIEANEELSRRQEVWKNTLAVMQTMTSPVRTSRRLRQIADSIMRGPEAMGVRIRRIVDGELQVVAQSGSRLPLGADSREPGSRHSEALERAYRDAVPVWFEETAESRDGGASVVEIPLLHRGRTNGVLEVVFRGGAPRRDDLLETLLPVASALGSLIEVENAHAEIKDSYRYLVRKLQSVTEIYHLESADHMDRIGAFSRLAARALGRSTEEQEDIEVFSRLHDIGKLRVPLSILAKPGRLTEEEMEIVKTHPLWGAELIGGASWLEMARTICLTHHEKWDGSGYPLGLSGDQIPWEGQVVALADVYDALRSRRVYKERMSHEQAVEVILKGDGRTSPDHFSPWVMEFFRARHRSMEDLFERYSGNERV